MRRAGLIVILCAACNPASTRPAFAPYPEAVHAVINAPPAKVTEEAKSWLVEQGPTVAHTNWRDGFLETSWYDAKDSSAA